MSIEILWEQWYELKWHPDTETMEHIPVYPTPEQVEKLLKGFRDFQNGIPKNR